MHCCRLVNVALSSAATAIAYTPAIRTAGSALPSCAAAAPKRSTKRPCSRSACRRYATTRATAPPIPTTAVNATLRTSSPDSPALTVQLTRQNTKTAIMPPTTTVPNTAVNNEILELRRLRLRLRRIEFHAVLKWSFLFAGELDSSGIPLLKHLGRFLPSRAGRGFNTVFWLLSSLGRRRTMSEVGDMSLTHWSTHAVRLPGLHPCGPPRASASIVRLGSTARYWTTIYRPLRA